MKSNQNSQNNNRNQNENNSQNQNNQNQNQNNNQNKRCGADEQGGGRRMRSGGRPAAGFRRIPLIRLNFLDYSGGADT